MGSSQALGSMLEETEYSYAPNNALAPGTNLDGKQSKEGGKEVSNTDFDVIAVFSEARPSHMAFRQEPHNSAN